ncbi:hypothetical protein KY339_02830, partial [Candidatus Woesearchaeota archaeon]|nr:hypothetical protein [Candidatus Woesearchaeota archaeon]
YTFTDRFGKTHHIKKGDYIDIYGGVAKDWFDRVPMYDEKTGRFMTQKLVWDDFVKEADEWNAKHPDEKQRNPEWMFFQAQIEQNAAQYRGLALYHSMRYQDELKERDKIIDALKFFEKLEAATPEEERWKLRERIPASYGHVHKYLVDESKLPSELLKDRLHDIERDIKHSQESAASYEAQSKDQVRTLRHMKPIGEYAIGESMKSYADAGIYAMDCTKERNLPNPVYVAPEQVFPEHGYGSHPDEMIELVQNSRKAMAERLVKERGFSETDAKKAAEDHIKMTLDTEHVGLWKKYFLRKPSEDEEQFTKRFNGWYMDHIKKMVDAGIVGNVHIADGFGYGHGNLPAGHGNLKVVDAISYLKKKGYTGPLSSEGYGDPTRMLTETWKAFGSPIYGAAGPVSPGAPVRWSDVEHSYFGRTHPPNYIFGAYSPSNDWQLWSQIPME